MVQNWQKRHRKSTFAFPTDCRLRDPITYPGRYQVVEYFGVSKLAFVSYHDMCSLARVARLVASMALSISHHHCMWMLNRMDHRARNLLHFSIGSSLDGRGCKRPMHLQVYDGMSVGNSSAISSVCAPVSSRHDLTPARTPARTSVSKRSPMIMI